MFNYKKFSLPIIFTTFFSYSTNKTELPCANSRYSQCLNCFSYLLPAVKGNCQYMTVIVKAPKAFINNHENTLGNFFLKLRALSAGFTNEFIF